MNTLSLEKWSNWFWHKWSPSYPEQGISSRLTQLIACPFSWFGSLFCETLISLQNRVSKTPVFSDGELQLQFTSLTRNAPGCSFQAAQKNPNRNRYPDVLPYDHNRVRLKEPNFYFNASRTLGGKAIASQGPLPHEVEDFWKMIWEENCSLIVMLANHFENGAHKCGSYWPIDTSTIRVQEAKQEVLATDGNTQIVKRTLEVIKGEESKTFIQLHLVNWPDHGTVASKLLAQLVHHTQREKKGPGPLLAHCSAGIGRTGTFLTAYQAFLTKSNRIFGIADSLRYERIGMIQRPEQYILAQRTAEQLINQ